MDRVSTSQASTTCFCTCELRDCIKSANQIAVQLSDFILTVFFKTYTTISFALMLHDIGLTILSHNICAIIYNLVCKLV